MGGLYNYIHGYNPACIWIMPMLGRKEEEWPRFRDCYVETRPNEALIVVYLRVGGPNRNSGYGEEELYEDPLFVETIDDEYDDTYAEYKFRVPERWKKDFNLILKGKIKRISYEYQLYLRKFFPSLNKEGYFDKIFGEEK